MTGHVNFLDKSFVERQGKSDADRIKSLAVNRANAKAMSLLAAKECPADLLEWGRVHGIPVFAEFTWQAGFIAGMHAAAQDDIEEDNHG
jgi:hypothetical protein